MAIENEKNKPIAFWYIRLFSVSPVYRKGVRLSWFRKNFVSTVVYAREAPDRKTGPELHVDFLQTDFFVVEADSRSGDFKLRLQRLVIQRVLANDQRITGRFHRPARLFVIIREVFDRDVHLDGFGLARFQPNPPESL
jgi:hypothetical protein